MEPLNSRPDFTQMEHEILQFWKEHDYFNKIELLPVNNITM